MLGNKCFKIFFVLIFLFGAVGNIAQAKSIDVITGATWGKNATLLKDVVYTYAQPMSIILADMTPTDTTASLRITQYLQGLSFYLAGFHHSDIPWYEIIGWDGKIYQGNTKGLGVSIVKNNANAIVIPYLDNGTFSSYAHDAFVSTIQDIATKIGIGQDAISAKSMTIQTDGSLQFSDPSIFWKTNTANVIKDSAIAKISTITQPKVSLSAISISGSTISFTLLSSGSVGVFGRIYIGSDKASPLATVAWVSSQRFLLNQSVSIQPNVTQQFSFPINVTKTSGDYTVALYSDAQKISGDSILVHNNSGVITASVATSVQSPTTQSITILSSSTGYVNVHADHSLSSSVIGKVTPGKTYDVVDTYANTAGKWYSIVFDAAGTKGWVTAQYAK